MHLLKVGKNDIVEGVPEEGQAQILAYRSPKTLSGVVCPLAFPNPRRTLRRFGKGYAAPKREYRMLRSVTPLLFEIPAGIYEVTTATATLTTRTIYVRIRDDGTIDSTPRADQAWDWLRTQYPVRHVEYEIEKKETELKKLREKLSWLKSQQGEDDATAVANDPSAVQSERGADGG